MLPEKEKKFDTMKHASKKKLETPKFSPYAFTAGVELEKRRNVIDTV